MVLLGGRWVDEEVREGQKRGTLTDYAWSSDAHDVTAFGEEQVHFFNCIWTVASLFCFRVVEKKNVLLRKVTVLYAYHFNNNKKKESVAGN